MARQRADNSFKPTESAIRMVGARLMLLAGSFVTLKLVAIETLYFRAHRKPDTIRACKTCSLGLGRRANC